MIAFATWVLGAFRDRSVITLITLFKSLVRSRQKYCSLLWDPSKVSDIQTIEILRRQFTRKIYEMSKIDYQERLKVLKLLSVHHHSHMENIK